MSGRVPEFVSLENLKTCEAAFHLYMKERYDMVFANSESVLGVRQKLYQIMTDVDRGPNADLSIRDKNNIALNMMRDASLAGAKGPQHETRPAKDTGSFLRREEALYGHRDTTAIIESAPPLTPISRPRQEDNLSVLATFEEAAAAYSAPPPPPIPNELVPLGRSRHDAGESDDVEALPNDEFERRVEALVLDRLALTPSGMEGPRGTWTESPPPPLDHGPSSEVTRRRDGSGVAVDSAVKAATIVNCQSIAMHGADRDIAAYPFRFRFGIRVTGYSTEDLQRTYRNISWLSVSSAIVPMEAQTGERGALSNTRPSLNEYDFSHPYLLVGVEGFDGIYDGSSDAIRRSFGVLVFDRAYRAPNGRGYVLLRPVCDTDRKVFDTPLANLRTLVVSLSRPNGTLLNNSVDVLNIVSLAYDTRFNLFVRVTCGRYFDRNEFFLGDTIRCSGFDGAGEDSKGGRQLNMYINRLEGHEVVRLGDVNSQGFSNSFYILAPGVYDSGEGSLILDEHTIDVIREIDTGSGAAKHGAVVNMSLQAFVTIKVGCQGPGH